jgi:hypothetical protein
MVIGHKAAATLALYHFINDKLQKMLCGFMTTRVLVQSRRPLEYLFSFLPCPEYLRLQRAVRCHNIMSICLKRRRLYTSPLRLVRIWELFNVPQSIILPIGRWHLSLSDCVETIQFLIFKTSRQDASGVFIYRIHATGTFQCQHMFLRTP